MLENTTAPLSEHQKNAYRHLLHMAMLDIRPMQWSLSNVRMLRPLRWRQARQEMQTNGALADWLHNLAQLASLDFEAFDEARFWDDGRHLARRDSVLFERYKHHYAQRLHELESGRG